MLTQGRFIFSAVLSMLVSSAAVAGCPVPKDLDVSLMLINFKGALVSEKLAEQIAWAFFQEALFPEWHL